MMAPMTCRAVSPMSLHQPGLNAATGAAWSGTPARLGEAVRARVREACGVELEWEIRRIGEPKGSQGPGGVA